MLRMLVLSAIVSGAAVLPAAADSRYYCSADDKTVSFTIESGFVAAPGHKLNHLRGALLLKDAALAPEFRKRVFTSEHLIHDWSYDGELRLEILDVPKDAPETSLDLVILAGTRGAGTASFSGTYALDIAGNRKITAQGKVTCGAK